MMIICDIWMLHRGEAVPPKPVDVVIDASNGSAVVNI